MSDYGISGNLIVHAFGRHEWQDGPFRGRYEALIFDLPSDESWLFLRSVLGRFTASAQIGTALDGDSRFGGEITIRQLVLAGEEMHGESSLAKELRTEFPLTTLPRPTLFLPESEMTAIGVLRQDCEVLDLRSDSPDRTTGDAVVKTKDGKFLVHCEVGYTRIESF